MKRVVLIMFLISNSVLFSQNKYLGESNWVSIDYLNCIGNNLPCECFSFRSHKNFFTLNIDTLKDSYYYNTYKVLRDDSILSFKVVDLALKFEEKKDSIIGLGIIENDTLIYKNFKFSVTNKFVRNDTLFWLSKIPGGLNYINSKLKESNNNSLQKILKSDSLICDCDIQYSINRIYNSNKIWVLEIKEDYLYIYKWKYPKRRGKLAKKKFKKKIYLGRKED